VKGSAAEAQLVLLVFRKKKVMLQKKRYYGSFKKWDGFPIGMKKENAHKLSSE
jgi:hypothetical protein